MVAALSLMVTALTICVNWQLKKYEVTFLHKRQGLGELLAAFRKVLALALRHVTPREMEDGYTDVDNAVYGLLPFLPKSDHNWLIDRSNEIELLLDHIWEGQETLSTSPFSAQYGDYEEKVAALRIDLFSKLFSGWFRRLLGWFGKLLRRG
ncbi:MAG: hypothetical protein ACRD1P_09610 [Thermoanaerobaculia bacterium]